MGLVVLSKGSVSDGAMAQQQPKRVKVKCAECGEERTIVLWSKNPPKRCPACNYKRSSRDWNGRGKREHA